ncbi:MAG: chemotaxis protein CheW [Gammaproteobacteria bacterium]|nr:chemotaxis protein CheW [Gammaproteobacteria bacterium]
MGQIIRASRQAVATESVPEKFLIFESGKEMYAIEVLRIKKIIEFGDNIITHVPMAPAYVRGILDLSGEAVPVIDLMLCFGEQPEAVTKRTCIVIVEVQNEEKTGKNQNLDIGVVVDSVHNVVELLSKDIAPPPRLGNQIRTRFIRGVGRVDQHFVILLNMNYILSLEELSALHQVKEQIQQ